MENDKREGGVPLLFVLIGIAVVGILCAILLGKPSNGADICTVVHEVEVKHRQHPGCKGDCDGPTDKIPYCCFMPQAFLGPVDYQCCGDTCTQLEGGP